LHATRSGSKRDLVLSQVAFYSGARGVLKVLAYMIEYGDDDELRRNDPAARSADQGAAGLVLERGGIDRSPIGSMVDRRWLLADYWGLVQG
jgi:hypothetical protein